MFPVFELVAGHDFILSEKIIRAKKLLSNPSAKVAAVSYELGFSDANYFIRAFKKLVGITPGSYQASGGDFGLKTPG